MSILLLDTLVQPVEALHLGRPGSWANSLLRRSSRPLSDNVAVGEVLQKRGVNKTIWILDKIYQGQTFFEYVGRLRLFYPLTISIVNGSFIVGQIIHSMYAALGY